MAKKDLDINLLKGMVLSPADVYWIKNSGVKTLIAKKADYLNYPLIEKLANAGHRLVLDEEMDFSFQQQFLQIVEAHRSEFLFKEKLPWRDRLFQLFLQKKISQDDLSQCAWSAWSRLGREEVKPFIDFDIDLFKRSLNISSSYVLCALLLGYYQNEFLRTIYTKTMSDLMSMEKIELMDRLKEEMEIIRGRNSLNEDDKKFVSRLYPRIVSWAGERPDGTGVHALNKKEMSDLELLMIALERHFSYREVESATVIDSILSGEFRCEEKLLAVLKKSLTKDLGAHLSA